MNTQTNLKERLEQYRCYTTETPVGVSGKYKFISTKQFISDVESQGYTLVSFYQPRQGLGYHTMEFTHPDLPKLEGIEFRLLATNSHNGTKPFTLGISILRQVCSNGLVAQTREQDARIIHVGYALDKVKAALAITRARFDGIVAQVNAFQNATPTEYKLGMFLSEASELRGDKARPHYLADLIQVKREGDKGLDAWTLFNRVQESLVRGGYHALCQTETGHFYKGSRVRELTSLSERVKLNKALWDLAVKYFIGA